MSYSWHKQWQSLFPPKYREVTLGVHRSDIRIGDTTIEFQSSPITTAEMSEREQFYSKILWILDARRTKGLLWKAIESLDRKEFYVEFWIESTLGSRNWDVPESWYRPSVHVILHLGGHDLIWITNLIATTFGYGVYIQLPILVERFCASNFARPLNNLYQLPGRNKPSI